MTAFGDSKFLTEIYEAGMVKISGLTWEIVSISINSNNDIVGFETIITLNLLTVVKYSKQETMTVSEKTLKTLTGYTKETQR